MYICIDICKYEIKKYKHINIYIYIMCITILRIGSWCSRSKGCEPYLQVTENLKTSKRQFVVNRSYGHYHSKPDSLGDTNKNAQIRIQIQG